MANDKPRCKRDCWCGTQRLEPFSDDYQRCMACGTLVSQVGMTAGALQVQDDSSDFYGKDYWLGHMTNDLGFPTIHERARLDLPERCLYWLRQLLAYKRPPGKVIELGCAHAGLVSLLHWTGFEALGLEMSPWVAELAQKTFDVPVLVGPLENQDLHPGSLDAIVANDVLEHLPDPLTTLQHCRRLLKPDGILVIQMPEYPEEMTYEAMVAGKQRFLLHMEKSDEHLFLYSKRAARALLRRLGLTHVNFHEPIFDYDMYFVASSQPQEARPLTEIAACLAKTPAGRLVLALLDKSEEVNRVTARWQESEQDRAARLVVINQLVAQLADSEADRARRLEVICDLSRQLAATVQEQQTAIATQQTALVFLQAACRKHLGPAPMRRPAMWKWLPKKLAKLILPAGVRHQIRKHLLAPAVPDRSAHTPTPH